MQRRQFIFELGIALACPLAADAQPAGKLWRIGFLAVRPSTMPVWDAFVQELRERGYVEGRNLLIELRYSRGEAQRFADFASEFLHLNVDVIVAVSTPAAKAAKQASSTLPIVAVYVGDPVGSGLVASLARPGGNVTGVSAQASELTGKQLELLHEMVPSASRIAVFWDPSNPPHLPSLRGVESTAQALKIDVQSYQVRTADDLQAALAAITRERAMGLLPFDSGAIAVHRRRLIEFAAENRLPAIYPHRAYVNDGGLMSYGPSLAELFRKAAVFVAKIFGGAKPGELPVEQPTKFELVINSKTAKALGLTVPPSLLARADEVIE